MANNQQLKDSVATVIKQNNNNEITGEILQSALIAIINQFGSGAVFAGMATPTTVPVNGDIVAFYMANTNGVYPNLGGYTLTNNDLVIFSNKTGVYTTIAEFNVAGVIYLAPITPGTLAARAVLPTMKPGNKYVFEALPGYYTFGGANYDALPGKRWLFVGDGSVWMLVDMGELSSKTPNWDAAPYSVGTQVLYNGILWQSNAATLATEVPGASSKWFDALTNKASLIPGKNLFNKATVTPNVFISSTTGGFTTNTDYVTSDFIKVTPSNRYTGNGVTAFRAFFDETRALIPTSATGSSLFVDIPATAFYYRISFSKLLLDTFQFERSSLPTAFEPYTPVIPNATIRNKSILPEKIVDYSITGDKYGQKSVNRTSADFFEVGTNLFDYTDPDILRGYFLGSIGQPGANAGYSVSGWIPFKEGQTAISSHRAYGTTVYTQYYNSSRELIGAGNQPTTAAPAGTAWMRDTIGVNSTGDLSVVQIQLGTNKTAFQKYLNALKLDSLPTQVLKFSDLPNLPEAIIKPKNTTFFEPGLNLLDLNDPDFKPLFYIGATGGFSASVDYNTSGFIRLDRVGTIFFSANGAAVSARFVLFYDANKSYMPGEYYQNVTSLAIPVGAAYVRVSYAVTRINFQVEISVVFSKTYLPYGIGLSLKYVPPSVARDTIDAFLPKEFCVLLGRSYDIYNNMVSYAGNYKNFNFQWSAVSGTKTIGEMYTDKFNIDTTSKATSLLGTYVLTLAISDNNGNIIVTLTGSLRVVNVVKAITTPLNGLPFGDSLTNKPTLPETRYLLGQAYGKEVLRWVGTRLYNNVWQTPADQALYCNNEGLSGYRQEQFLNAGFGGGIRIYVSNVVVAPAPKKQYRFNSNIGLALFEVEDVFNQNGQLYSAFGGTITTITLNVATGQSSSSLIVNGATTGGTATGVSGSVAGDSTLTYSKYDNTGGNPFWNPATQAVDFPNYFSSNGLPTPDFFRTMLGTNAITDVASMIALINLIKTQVPNKPIFVFLPQYPGNYLISPSIRRSWFNFAKNICLAFENTANVYCIPIAYSHDSEYNYLNVEENINPRNSTFKRWKPSDNTHPQKGGYFQMSDVEVGMLAAYVYN
jgi:hypothetical protein